MSQSETKTITVPALVYSAVPVVSTQTTETAVTVSATGNGTVKLYVNGQQVANPYTAARGNSTYTITAYATAKESGKVMSQSETKTITVPALVYSAVPVISKQTTETAVTVTATGSGTVKLYVNGQQVSNPYSAARGNSDYTITAYATAKEDGKVMSQSQTMSITVPALVYTAVPVISKQTTETAVTVTATGSGTVKLYVNGQQVSNPYSTARGNSDYTITAYATAKEDGKLMSQSQTMSITVPALTIEPNANSFTVNGVTFEMVTVDGGTFLMGATPEQGENVRDNEKPVHEVTLSSYLIGQTEVTQELWLAVMGNNPSYHTGNLQRPVDMVSWMDCQEFISRLNQLTGKTFRLPTEAEWEYAARGGNKSQGYRYAGSDDMLAVAWCENNSENSTHPVGTKAPNELGLYDMTGNVWEWCNDWYKRYTEEAQINPTGPETGNNRVLRGGCWNGDFIYNRISYRDNFIPTGSNSSGGLRLALDVPEVYTVNGVSFTMIPVDGGTFRMGATEEQGEDVINWELPVHEVTLSSYCIGETEVTQELWLAVMGTNPSKNPGDLQRPVENVTWTDCQEFIAQLNALTGRNFRLPTEAEWEFAARGGNKSKGYKYSGSNNVNDVAWIADGTHAVAQLQPNELYLYDMSGNVEEWIWDYFDYYTSDPQTDPTGPETGTNRIYRGGSWYSGESTCRVSFRMHRAESFKRGTMGLRLAL
jgi:formylglycine-generating enzyme required for sulfatase activity